MLIGPVLWESNWRPVTQGELLACSVVRHPNAVEAAALHVGVVCMADAIHVLVLVVVKPAFVAIFSQQFTFPLIELTMPYALGLS